MPLDWTPFVDLVGRHRRFVLTTHIRPDGDGLGSILALGEVLQSLGKEVGLTVGSSIPDRYDFLDPGRRVQEFAPPGERYRDAEVVVVMDTGTWNQLGAFGTFMQELPAARVVIDHHLTQDDMGALRLVDTTAEATGRLSYEAITALGAPLTPSVAEALFVALAMDTGWFRHANTTPATHELAGRLLAAGVKPDVIYEKLFEQNTLGRLRLTGCVLGRLRVDDDPRVAYTEIFRDDYASTGATPPESEDLVNFTRSVVGVEVGMLLMEQPRGGTKVSFRSRALVDVARIAEKFGGGGHSRAAGAVIQAPLDEVRTRVLDAVRAALPPAG